MVPAGGVGTADEARPRHEQSWYAATRSFDTRYPALAGELDCDVCVVGAGMTGCSAALELASRGYDVVVLEAQRVAWGASGRSGGQMMPGFACDMSKLRGLVGAEDAQRLWDMSVEALELVRERVRVHGIDCDLRDGHLHAAIKPRQVEGLKQWQAELQNRYGHAGMEFWDHGQLGEVLTTDRYLAGVYDRSGGHLHPLNYTLGVARAAERAGARFFEDSAVTRISHRPAPVAYTAAGMVRCRHLLLCGNAYLAGVVRDIEATIMPVGTYILATSPLGENRARQTIGNDMAVADVNFVLDYFRLSADYRMLFGGRVSYSKVAPPNLPVSMRRRMLKVFPQLEDLAIDYTWGGYVAITMNRAPHFGRLDGDVYFMHGFSGQGVVLTSLAGKVAAEAVAGSAERFDVFARIPHAEFPGGRWMRTPALVLAMLYYRIRDML